MGDSKGRNNIKGVAYCSITLRVLVIALFLFGILFRPVWIWETGGLVVVFLEDGGVAGGKNYDSRETSKNDLIG